MPVVQVIDRKHGLLAYHVVCHVTRVPRTNRHLLERSTSIFPLMADRIVSWSDNKLGLSPVMSSTASIVSFDSTFSDTQSYREMSPTASSSEVPWVPSASAEFDSKHANLLKFPEEGTPRDAHATPDESFVRHDSYFFNDGNVTFLIDGTLYCVHRYFFSRDSVYFSARFAKLGIRDHEALPTIISLDDVKRNDFETFLSVLYPVNFEAHELSYEQWKSVLHLSTRWGFASIRELALKSITPPTSHDQLVLARTYSVDEWVLPALIALCSRTLPLSFDEAQQMNMGDVVLVAMVREKIRGGVLRVDVADIPRYIEVVQAEKLNRPEGRNVYCNEPKGRNTEQESDPTMASGINPNVKVEDAKTIGVGLQQRTEKDADRSDVEHSSNEVPAESPGEDARQGLEQPHVVESIPCDSLEENVTTCLLPAQGTRKLEVEVASGEAAAWPRAAARAESAENQAAWISASEAEDEGVKAKREAVAGVKTKAEAIVKTKVEAITKAVSAIAAKPVPKKKKARANKVQEMAKAAASAMAKAEAEVTATAKAEGIAGAEATVIAKAALGEIAKAVAEASAKADEPAKAQREAREKAAEAKAKADRVEVEAVAWKQVAKATSAWLAK
ncbi:hypothetical protein EI94DRAFT_1681019 [Lactarius quietus]|nr:hypothetical protein EI94DRAFT_1681019 [Lactarius quietus]